METKEIKIIVTEKTTKDGKKKFNTYKTFSKNGRPTEVKFRQEVSATPKESGYYEFEAKDMNLNTSGEYPTLWIRGEYTKFRGLNETTAEQVEAEKKKLDEYFG